MADASDQDLAVIAAAMAVATPNGPASSARPWAETEEATTIAQSS